MNRAVCYFYYNMHVSMHTCTCMDRPQPQSRICGYKPQSEVVPRGLISEVDI